MHKYEKAPDGWSEDEIYIVLEKVLYQEMKYVNDILQFLNDKSLDDLVALLTGPLVIQNKFQRVKMICDECGAVFDHSLSRYIMVRDKFEHHFCTQDCSVKYAVKHGTFAKENNANYNSVPVKCSYCGKEFMTVPSELKKKNWMGENHKFCSKECFSKFRSEYYVGERNYFHHYWKDPANREKYLANMKIWRGHIKKANETRKTNTVIYTKPHMKINNILDRNKIEYENEYAIMFYSIDIRLDGLANDLFIEIMGDYWHSNPLVYSFKNANGSLKECDKRQIECINRDKRKYSFVQNRNMKTLYLWESDINKRPELCEALIKLYIQNNGQLENYNSFNYNDDLTLKDEIILPYFERKSA